MGMGHSTATRGHIFDSQPNEPQSSCLVLQGLQWQHGRAHRRGADRARCGQRRQAEKLGGKGTDQGPWSDGCLL